MSKRPRPAASLQAKLAANELTLGIIITNHLWLEVIEIAMDAGLDYVIVDLEHVSHGDHLVADACRIGRLTGFPILIRPPRTDAESIRLALDLGPCGLMLPMIDTAAQLDTVRDGLYMPPRGQRRPGGHGNWWVSDFNATTWRDELEDHLVILPQVESSTGLKNAAEIAAHPLTTALAVGPYDLSARLGVCWQPDAPELKQAYQTLDAAADAAHKPVWRIGDATALHALGYNFLCMAEPSFLLRAILEKMVTDLRQSGATSDDTPENFVP